MNHEVWDTSTVLRAHVPLAFPLPGAAAAGHGFDFMFPRLQADPDKLLPEDPTTFAKLVALGRTMRDPGPAGANDPGNTAIPAAYTYLGQFLAHDITLELQSASLPRLMDPELAPMTLTEIRSILQNYRTPTFELDNLYGGTALRDPDDDDRMAVGRVSPTGAVAPPGLRPPGKGDDNDVPRRSRSEDPYRTALVGDPRDDENLIIAQLQVAFLKAHNALVAQGRTFEHARRVLRRHYQHIVVHDFLRRVADPAIVDDILRNGPKMFDPAPGCLFMPLEFSVAVYRFGHSTISNAYDFNLNFNLHGGVPARLPLLLTFTALSGDLGDFDTLPENWIVEWENLVDAGGPHNRTRRIDTKLVEPLFELRDPFSTAGMGDGARLAVRDLLRGYLLRMPTGQAVAEALELAALSPAALRAAAANPEQVKALEDGGFLARTPLWFYVLAEASAGGGQRLGPVGSTVLADVVIGLARRSEDSIFDVPNWRPTLPSVTPGTFQLRDLLAFAGVLPGVVTRSQPAAPPSSQASRPPSPNSGKWHAT